MYSDQIVLKIGILKTITGMQNIISRIRKKRFHIYIPRNKYCKKKNILTYENQ